MDTENVPGGADESPPDSDVKMKLLLIKEAITAPSFIHTYAWLQVENVHTGAAAEEG